jgi:dihydrofolate reductase
MRKLIVSNFMTIDGYYEAGDHDIGAFFKHHHRDYDGDDSFDHYNLALFEAADFLLLAHNSFLGNQAYWTSVPNDPKASEVRRKIAARMAAMEKLVISDRLTPAEFAGWANTRVIARAEAHDALTAIKAEDGGDIVVIVSRLMWNDLLQQGLVDELHLTVFPLIAGDGVKIFASQPPMPVKLIETRELSGGSGRVLLRYAVEPKATGA